MITRSNNINIKIGKDQLSEYRFGRYGVEPSHKVAIYTPKCDGYICLTCKDAELAEALKTLLNSVVTDVEINLEC